MSANRDKADQFFSIQRYLNQEFNNRGERIVVAGLAAEGPNVYIFRAKPIVRCVGA